VTTTRPAAVVAQAFPEILVVVHTRRQGLTVHPAVVVRSVALVD